MNAHYLIRSSLALGSVLVTFWIAQAVAQSPPGHPAANIQVTECVVYPETEPSRTADCTAYVQKACRDVSSCEVKIGLALTGGRDLTGDPKSWKKVRIRYRCGEVPRVNGPYVQSEHATVRLSCG
jgi:hypothetical protein